MKRELHPARLKKLDFWLLIVPAAFWLALTYARPYLMTPRCARAPESCQAANLPAIDRIAYQMELPGADAASFYAQNSAIVMGIGLPLLWNVGLAIASPVTFAAFAANALTDLTLFGEVSMTNGAITEAVRVIAQRPRPYVYKNPTGEGGESSNYVSFYSGHTSFTAAATVATLVLLIARGAPLAVLLLALGVGETLCFSTAIFRVLSGRHFVTDVIVALIAGSLTAVFFLRYRFRADP